VAAILESGQAIGSLYRSNYFPSNINPSQDQHEIVQQNPDSFISQEQVLGKALGMLRGTWDYSFFLKALGTTLSTFAKLLKLFWAFQNQPQFIILNNSIITTLFAADTDETAAGAASPGIRFRQCCDMSIPCNSTTDGSWWAPFKTLDLLKGH
jgi:hypothetical protein